MIDRRSFLTSGVALATALTVAPSVGGSATQASAGTTSPEPTLALIDRQLDGSAEFAANARARGWRTIEFTRDSAGVWMRDLEPRLRLGPVAIAGYTSAATLFCLDLLARDYGARTMQRDESAAAVTWVIASSPGRRAPLAPAGVRTPRSDSHA